MKNSLLVTLFLFLSVSAFAQRNVSVEITAGAISSFSSATNSVDGSKVPMENSIGGNAGLSLLFPISEKWDLYSEFGFYRNGMRNEIKNPTNEFYLFRSIVPPAYTPSFSIGGRYNFSIKKPGFYVQPGLTLSTSTSMGAMNGFDGSGESTLEQINKIGTAIRLDVGKKFMTKKDNYFLLGLRYQQGITGLNNYTNPLISNGVVLGEVTQETKGSFFGVFVGYGLNTGNWKRSSKK
ncbi:outer membrane beta-barrel protein [Algoriphagus chordae]|uniref:Outer membrane protein beta-barrel domain-containing protein n=1 Tax=Algoriphagus chordae TaxID=237019 RepID=A0A2W7QKK6_9BACT|nr:outer membrane beta-barrel protein [Algoriphagus chordae]PZX48651.1 hypothetical protein LV85_03465 [Algoriphagus chordae]